jgi:hypothetical protein
MISHKGFNTIFWPKNAEGAGEKIFPVSLPDKQDFPKEQNTCPGDWITPRKGSRGISSGASSIPKPRAKGGYDYIQQLQKR